MKPLYPYFIIGVLAAVLSGCTIVMDRGPSFPDQRAIDFSDPVLNHRQIFLFGEINQAAAEETIQKLLYLDAHGQEPIHLFLMTPGGEL